MLETIDVSLLGQLLNYESIRAYKEQCRPIIEFECVPYIEFAIIYAGVLHIVTHNCLSQHVSRFLFVKFGTVDTNESNLREVLKLRFKFLQFSKHMNAVDAATCPKVNN